MAQAIDDVVASSMIADDIAPDIDTELERAPDDPGRFRITEEGAAEWALRKLRKIRAQHDANIALAEAEMQRIANWCEEVNGSLERSIAFFEGLLIEYHNAVLLDDPDRKTIKLPAGTLKARKRPARWEIDGAAFIAWAKLNRSELVRVIEEADRSELKRVFVANPSVTASVADPDTGEIVLGIAVIEGEVGFSVEVSS